jgi:branched-chain amino acid transport system ATP-binding protein
VAGKMTAELLLEIDSVHAGYGRVDVLHDICITLKQGEFISIVGPNGAGKTTLFKTISGLVTPSAGSIKYKGNDLLSVEASRRAYLGLSHVPEGRQVFPALTVLENLEMGAFARNNNQEFSASLEKIYTWFPILKDRQAQTAGTLSGGEQQMLAIGRGLAALPEVLMLDEPSMGLAPAIADEIFERLIEIHQTEGLSILLVEQRVAEALHFADRAYVLEAGKIILSGNPEKLRNNDRIRQAYLGM